MDVQKELGKWKSEYVKCNTPEELADHKKRFRAFLQTLSPEDKKAFAQAFQDGARQSINEAQNSRNQADLRKSIAFRFYVVYCPALFWQNTPMAISTD